MYPAPFEYHRAASAGDAVALLEEYKDQDAKLLAGGHSLIPLLKLRFAQPHHLIDVRHIAALHGIQDADTAIVIGAATTHWMVQSSPVIARRVPMLAEAAAKIGDPQVRNMGTIGGSLAHADPAADLPAVILALGARLSVLGPRGARVIAADDFFVDLLTTALAPDEILTDVRVPVTSSGTGGAYEKYPHPASGYALVGVASRLTLRAGVVESARVALTGVGTKPLRARGVETVLTGQTPDAATIARAALEAAAGLDLRSDAVGTAEWRRAVLTAYATRAIARSADRARAT